MGCPLCQCTEGLTLVLGKTHKNYWRCRDCDLIHLARNEWPTLADENRRYENHNNTVADFGYRQFFEIFLSHLNLHLPPESDVLEFGCGPDSVVSHALKSRGHAVFEYDPHFRPDSSVLRRRYPFISATEVVEHFHHPAKEFQNLRELLVPGGELWVMTSLHDEVKDFAGWHYRRDKTHVCFYSTKSFEWIGQKFGFASIEISDLRIVRLKI